MRPKIHLHIKPRNPDRVLWHWLCDLLRIPHTSTVGDIEGKIKALPSSGMSSIPKLTPDDPGDSAAFISDNGKVYVWNEFDTHYDEVSPAMFLGEVYDILDKNGVSGVRTIPTITGRFSSAVPHMINIPKPPAGKRTRGTKSLIPIATKSLEKLLSKKPPAQT